MVHDFGIILKAIKMLRLKRNISTPGFNVITIWNETVAQHAEKTAVLFENRRVSFRDMERMSNQMAAWLTKQGIKKGDALALAMQNKPEFICW